MELAPDTKFLEMKLDPSICGFSVMGARGDCEIKA
jgi:hypothetical protein